MNAGPRPADGAELDGSPSIPHLPRATPTQKALGIAVLLSYGVGYPVALVVYAALGWVLVTLGGVFLLALGVVTVRRIHRAGPA